MRVALMSLAFSFSLASSLPAAAGAKIVVLHQDVLSEEEEVLTQALRIYTRDLRCEVLVEGIAPASLDVPSLAQLQSRARHDGAVDLLWVGSGDGGGVIYYAFDVVSGDLRETQVGSAGAPMAAQEVALKVRALLWSRRWRSKAKLSAEAPARDNADEEPSVTDTASSPANTQGDEVGPSTVASPAMPTAPPPREAPADQPTQGATTPDSKTAAVVVRSRQNDSSAYRPARFAFAAGLGVVTPWDRTWTREGVVVALSVRFSAPRIKAEPWVYVEGLLSDHPAANVRGFDLTLADLPLTAGALLRLRLPHGSLALGPRTTMHVFDVKANAPDGLASSSRRYALGLGGAVRGEAELGWRVGVFLEASVEALVPNEKFTIAGEPAISTGGMLFGVVGGLTLAVF